MSYIQVQQNENQIDENSSKNRGPFTSEEDMLLLDLYARYGKKWKEISQHFVDRTPISLKTYLEAS